MQNKATKFKTFKTSNASRFFLITSWLIKGKFLYTEEYKPIDSMHTDSIFFSLKIVCHVMLVGERILTVKSVKLQRKTSNLGFFWEGGVFLNLSLF